MIKADDYITPMVELAFHIKPLHEKYLSQKLKRQYKLFKPLVKKGNKTLMIKFIGRKAKNEEMAPQVGFELTYDVGQDLYNIKAFYSPAYPKIDIMDPEWNQKPMPKWEEPIWGKTLRGMFFDDLEDPAKIYYDLIKRIPSHMSSKKIASKEYVIWGIPEGKSSDELLLTEVQGRKITSRGMAKKYADLLENKYGARKTRIQEIDLEGEFDWMKMISKKQVAEELVKIANLLVSKDILVALIDEKGKVIKRKGEVIEGQGIFDSSGNEYAGGFDRNGECYGSYVDSRDFVLLGNGKRTKYKVGEKYPEIV